MDEIIVVDSGSSDGTEAICRADPKVRFFQHEWEGYGRQKNIAAAFASHDWVLNLDADERVTPELQFSLLSAQTDKFAAFRMSRQNFFGSRWIRRCGWYPDYTARYYHRSRCGFSERAVHETLECRGTTATLSGNLLHFTYSGISDYLKRMDNYSTLAAEEILKAGKTATIFDIMVKPLATFLKMYFLRGGVLEGSSGFILSCLYACYTMCKYAKARERLTVNQHTR